MQLAIFNEVVKEVRIRYPDPNSTEAILVIVLKDIDVSAKQAEAMAYVQERIQNAVNKEGRFTLVCDAWAYSEISLRVYEASQPLNLDYLTRWGDELLDSSGVFRTLS